MGRKGFLALWEGQLKIVLSGFMGTSSVACGATFPSGARLFVSPRLQGYTRAEKPAGQGFLCHRARKVIPKRKSRQGKAFCVELFGYRCGIGDPEQPRRHIVGLPITIKKAAEIRGFYLVFLFTIPAFAQAQPALGAAFCRYSEF